MSSDISILQVAHTHSSQEDSDKTVWGSEAFSILLSSSSKNQTPGSLTQLFVKWFTGQQSPVTPGEAEMIWQVKPQYLHINILSSGQHCKYQDI